MKVAQQKNVWDLLEGLLKSEQRTKRIMGYAIQVLLALICFVAIPLIVLPLGEFLAMVLWIGSIAALHFIGKKIKINTYEKITL